MALRIIEKKGDRFDLNLENLERILLDESVRDRKVFVVSIAGAYRKGKSFMLNLFLRYLSSNGENWLGEPGQLLNLEGFRWGGGSQRETSGVLLWSEPFVLKLDDGSETAVLLMDTQGTFESETCVHDDVTIFALSTLLSSVQIYNLSSNIQRDDLQHLNYFADYGRVVANAKLAEVEKPFQRLIFLMRDWPNVAEYEYGKNGGARFLEKRLETTGGQHEQVTDGKDHIRSCFEKIDCFLMPHPGRMVANSPDQDKLRVADIDEEFVREVTSLMSDLFAADGLRAKNVHRNGVTGTTLLKLSKEYMAVFRGRCTLPEAMTLLQATSAVLCQNALSLAVQSYKSGMDGIIIGNPQGLDPTHFRHEHERISQSARSIFHANCRLGTDKMHEPYVCCFDETTTRMYDDYAAKNREKWFSLRWLLERVSREIALSAAVIGLKTFTHSFDCFTETCRAMSDVMSVPSTRNVSKVIRFAAGTTACVAVGTLFGSTATLFGAIAMLSRV